MYVHVTKCYFVWSCYCYLWIANLELPPHPIYKERPTILSGIMLTSRFNLISDSINYCFHFITYGIFYTITLVRTQMKTKTFLWPTLYHTTFDLRCARLMLLIYILHNAHYNTEWWSTVSAHISVCLVWQLHTAQAE